METFFESIDAILLPDEPLKNHTTFCIGGPTPLLVIPRTEEALVQAIEICKDNSLDRYILGNGSNLLVSDQGLNKIVIKLTDYLGETEVMGEQIRFGAGLKLSKCCLFAAENELAGMEFSYGIPGTVGGAVYMNAGAYGGEMKDIIESVTFLTSEGELQTKNRAELEISYRHSEFMDHQGVILSVVLQLKKEDSIKIKEKMRELYGRRKKKQPLEFPSAGSVFKRPEGAYASALIEECGLKGTRVGDAQVSEKHSGFIVNIGQATCRDVLELIDIVQKSVFEKTGILLEREIKLIGEGV